MLKFPIYLDHNSTTPCDERVVQAMLPYFTKAFGNAASRTHAFGWEAEEAVLQARESIARLIGAEPNEIIFTSGATESDNLALKGVFESYRSRGAHIITTRIEHKAVLDGCRHLEKLGADLTYLDVKEDGMIDLEELEAAIRPDTILIAVMYANNEIGTILPVRDISTIARKHGIVFFSDAAQAVGKIPVNVNQDGIDIMALTAHKLYGPKGIGALYIRRKSPRVRLIAQMDGGGHERGMRSGTLNVPGIVGFGKACDICEDGMPGDASRLASLRDLLEESLVKVGARVNGNRQQRLPHTSNLSFDDMDGEALISALNKTIAVSSGSACSSASMEPSYVLKALGLDDETARGSIRFGLGRHTTEEEIRYAINEVSGAVTNMRALRVII